MNRQNRQKRAGNRRQAQKKSAEEEVKKDESNQPQDTQRQERPKYSRGRRMNNKNPRYTKKSNTEEGEKKEQSPKRPRFTQDTQAVAQEGRKEGRQNRRQSPYVKKEGKYVKPMRKSSNLPQQQRKARTQKKEAQKEVPHHPTMVEKLKMLWKQREEEKIKALAATQEKEQPPEEEKKVEVPEKPKEEEQPKVTVVVSTTEPVNKKGKGRGRQERRAKKNVPEEKKEVQESAPVEEKKEEVQVSVPVEEKKEVSPSTEPPKVSPVKKPIVVNVTVTVSKVKKPKVEEPAAPVEQEPEPKKEEPQEPEKPKEEEQPLPATPVKPVCLLLLSWFVRFTSASASGRPQRRKRVRNMCLEQPYVLLSSPHRLEASEWGHRSRVGDHLLSSASAFVLSFDHLQLSSDVGLTSLWCRVHSWGSNNGDGRGTGGGWEDRRNPPPPSAGNTAGREACGAVFCRCSPAFDSCRRDLQDGVDDRSGNDSAGGTWATVLLAHGRASNEQSEYAYEWHDSFIHSFRLRTSTFSNGSARWLPVQQLSQSLSAYSLLLMRRSTRVPFDVQ